MKIEHLYASLGEYRLFDSLEGFTNNKYSKAGVLDVKNDHVIVPKLPSSYIVYIRIKRPTVISSLSYQSSKSILIVHDTSAYAEFSPVLYQQVMWCPKGIYAKEQSLNIYKDMDRFVVGYHFPHWHTFKHLNSDFNSDRDIDIMYAGKYRKQRRGLYDDLERTCKKNNLKYIY